MPPTAAQQSTLDPLSSGCKKKTREIKSCGRGKVITVGAGDAEGASFAGMPSRGLNLDRKILRLFFVLLVVTDMCLFDFSRVHKSNTGWCPASGRSPTTKIVRSCGSEWSVNMAK